VQLNDYTVVRTYSAPASFHQRIYNEAQTRNIGTSERLRELVNMAWLLEEETARQEKDAGGKN